MACGKSSKFADTVATPQHFTTAKTVKKFLIAPVRDHILSVDKHRTTERDARIIDIYI